VDTLHLVSGTNRAPVSVQLVPNTDQLSIDAIDGTLLRRSTVALFEGLARRPLGGEEWVGARAGAQLKAPDPYTTLPQTCLGATCSKFIAPTYSFTSSNPQIGTFVAHDPNSINPLQIALDPQGKPVADAASGLFCAFNPGTTTVTISSGGVSDSIPVTVQSGSVRQPCGTVEVTQIGTPTTPTTGTPGPGTQPQPTPTPIHITPPPVPVPVPPPAPVPPLVHVPPTVHLTSPPVPVFLPFVPVAASFPRALFPVTTLTPRPTPPTGFTAVVAASPVAGRVTEEERDEEHATESASAFAAYHPAAPNQVLPAAVVIVLLLALGCSGARFRRRGRPRGGAAFARLDAYSDHRPWDRPRR
jgi:hypothetical protein